MESCSLEVSVWTREPYKLEFDLEKRGLENDIGVNSGHTLKQLPSLWGGRRPGDGVVLASVYVVRASSNGVIGV